MSNIENANTKLSLPMLISIANALSVSADTLLCDSVIHSKEIFAQEIQSAVADCDEYEIRILTEILKASKRALRQNKKLNSTKKEPKRVLFCLESLLSPYLAILFL